MYSLDGRDTHFQRRNAFSNATTIKVKSVLVIAYLHVPSGGLFSAVYNRFHFSVQSFGDVSALDKLPLLTHISLACERRLSSR